MMTKMFDLEHCGQCGEETDELYCGFLCEECEKKDRANAALGKAVRALPLDYALAHYLGKWVVEDGDYCVVSEGDTPEAAIAALEVGNENV